MKKSPGFTVVEILIYMVILAMFFMAARVGYNSFIARKRVETVVRKVESLFVKACGLSFSPGFVAGCTDAEPPKPLGKYVVTLSTNQVKLSGQCPGVIASIETYSFEGGVVSSVAEDVIVGYKLLGHGLDVVEGFFGTPPSDRLIVFNRAGQTTNGVILTISQSGEVMVASQ